MYLKILTPGVLDENVVPTFNVIDTNNDGKKISLQEFVSAVLDYVFNTKETGTSKAILGSSV